MRVFAYSLRHRECFDPRILVMMNFLKCLTIGWLVLDLGAYRLHAQPVITQPGALQNRPATGISDLRITSQSADGTEVVLTIEYGYDGLGGPTALIVPMIEKRGQKGVAAWFGADPVTIGAGRGIISIKVKYFNDEAGVPPQFTSDSLRILTLNKSGTAILSSIPFLKTIKWGSPNAKPPTITLAQSTPSSGDAKTESKARVDAEEKERARADAEAKSRQKSEDASKRLDDKKAKQEAEKNARAEARLKAEQEAKRLADEKRIAEENAKQEAEARAEARRKADAEAKVRREAEKKAKKESAAREAAQRKAEAEAKKLAAEAKKAEKKAMAEARVKEKARLAEEAKAREEARVKAESEAKRLTEEKRQADEQALAEAKAREDARIKAEAEESSRREADRLAAADAKAREAARVKAEAEAKRLASEQKSLEKKSQELPKIQADSNVKPNEALIVSPTLAIEAIAAGLKTKITNVDVVNRTLDRTQMTIGVEYDYRDSLGPKPMLGVDVTKQSEPAASRYFLSAPAEIGKSRRNFVLFPVKFQPPSTVVAPNAYQTDNLLVYLIEATSAKRFNLYPATMLLTWRLPGSALSANAISEPKNKLELDEFRQNDLHTGYVTVKYHLVNGPGKLRVRVFQAANPASADWFLIEPKAIKTGQGVQVIEIAVAPDAKTASLQLKVDTLAVELLDSTGKILDSITKHSPMTWAKPE